MFFIKLFQMQWQVGRSEDQGPSADTGLAP